MFYSNWETPQQELIPGYSIMVLTPGDLPVFLKIALAVCETQNPEHLFETLIIPDNRMRSGFSELFKRWTASTNRPIRLVPQQWVERQFTRFHKNAHNNCWLQMVRGINAARTTHAVWHDVDLFIHEPDFLKKHYETCVENNYACLGVSEAWDSWFREQGIHHLVGTWEMMVDTRWVRSFAPWQHRGHDEEVLGQTHTCDITFWAQYQTPVDRVGRHQRDWEFTHFNYVTGNYRRFQRSRGPFEDEYFRLLLVRLLIDAYDDSGWKYEVPDLTNLLRGIQDASNRVTYVRETTQQYYPTFRAKLQKLIDSGLLSDRQASTMASGVGLFDKALGYSSLSSVA